MVWILASGAETDAGPAIRAALFWDRDVGFLGGAGLGLGPRAGFSPLPTVRSLPKVSSTLKKKGRLGLGGNNLILENVRADR